MSKPLIPRAVQHIPAIWVVAITAAVMLLVGIFDGHLRQDPLVYGSVSRQIIDTGHWDQLYYGKTPYLNKPPLFFWLTACLFHVGGISTATVRLASIIPGIAFVLLLYAWIRQRGIHPETAGWVAITAALCPLFLEHAGAGRIESLLLLGLVGGAWVIDHQKWRGTTAKTLGCSLFSAIGWLSKGPAAGIYLPIWLILLSKKAGTSSPSRSRWIVPLLSNLFGSGMFYLWWSLQAHRFGHDLLKETAQREFAQRIHSQASELSHTTGYYLEKAAIGFLPLLLCAAILFFISRKTGPSSQTSPAPKSSPIHGFVIWPWIAVVALSAALMTPPAGRYLLPVIPALALLCAELTQPVLDVEKTGRFTRGLAAVFIGVALALDVSPMQMHKSLPKEWVDTLEFLEQNPSSSEELPSVGPCHWEARGILCFYAGIPVRQVDPPDLRNYPPGTWVILRPEDFAKLTYLFDSSLDVAGQTLARTASR